MKKYVWITALFLVFMIVPIQTACAYSHYHNYSSSHTEVWVDTTSLVVLLATLAAGNRDNEKETAKEQAAYEQKVREIREHARESSRKEMEHAIDLIFERGVPATVELLIRSWDCEGKKTFLDDRNGVSFLKVSGFEENVRLEYKIRQESKEISVRVTAPDYTVSEESSAYYKEPEPIPPSKRYLGFELEEFFRDSRGRLIIKDVVKGTAAFYAGALPGESLVLIDTYDTKNFDIARINSYLEKRSEIKAKVKITVSQKGKQKIIEIQL